MLKFTEKEKQELGLVTVENKGIRDSFKNFLMGDDWVSIICYLRD